MKDWLCAQAAARPDGLALTCQGTELSYEQLDAQVGRAVSWLATFGVLPGDRVALLLPNTAEAVILVHALARRGAVMVWLNTRLTAIELRDQLGLVRCAALIHTADTAALAAPLRDCVAAVLAINAASLSDQADDPACAQGEIALESPAAIMFTSGTSGAAKAAELSWGNFWHAAQASAYRIGVLPHDRWLCALPLFHVGGLSIVLRSCLYGTAVDLQPKADAATLHAVMMRDPVTLVSLVPTLLHRILALRSDADAYPALRLVLLGGASAEPELLARAGAAGIPVAPTYGLTEACSQVATALPDRVARNPKSVGTALSFTEVRVIDDAGADSPPGAYGQIIVRGPTVMRGYVNDPAATAQTIRDGWLWTGDIGYLDPNTRELYVVQRRSDLIVTGGENVYPAEVEAALRQHPRVAQCVVAGLPSAEWGQRVAALVTLTPGGGDSAAIPAELITFCRARLAGYKVPRSVCVAPELPVLANGKLDRARIREVLGSCA